MVNPALQTNTPYLNIPAHSIGVVAGPLDLSSNIERVQFLSSCCRNGKDRIYATCFFRRVVVDVDGSYLKSPLSIGVCLITCKPILSPY